MLICLFLFQFSFQMIPLLFLSSIVESTVFIDVDHFDALAEGLHRVFPFRYAYNATDQYLLYNGIQIMEMDYAVITVALGIMFGLACLVGRYV